MELDEQPQDQLQEICSLLIANGYIPKDQFQQLMYDDELRARVENRLDLVGLKLLQNVYSATGASGSATAPAATSASSGPTTLASNVAPWPCSLSSG